MKHPADQAEAQITIRRIFHGHDEQDKANRLSFEHPQFGAGNNRASNALDICADKGPQSVLRSAVLYDQRRLNPWRPLSWSCCDNTVTNGRLTKRCHRKHSLIAIIDKKPVRSMPRQYSPVTVVSPIDQRAYQPGKHRPEPINQTRHPKVCGCIRGFTGSGRAIKKIRCHFIYSAPGLPIAKLARNHLELLTHAQVVDWSSGSTKSEAANRLTALLYTR